MQIDYYSKSKEILAKSQIEKEDYEILKSALIYHERKYYIDNEPIVSDYEYDQLYKKLEELESRHPDIVAEDSPTQRVSSDLTETGVTVKHMVPMLSLGNSYNMDDLIDFDRQIKKLCGLDEDSDVAYNVEPKFDGGSITVTYKDGYLVQAATRGNGSVGEEMTPNAKAMPTLPLRADFQKYGMHHVEVRGEALIRKDVFDKINSSRVASGQAAFANPRNAATGGLRTKDANETRNRGLEVFAFQIGYAVDNTGRDVLEDMETHSKSIEILEDQGFKVYSGIKVAKNIQEAGKICQEWEDKRESYPYEIDGMVIKVNSLELQEECGSTQHHPRWAIAYKFKAKQATTTLQGVEYQVGKVGSITPVAKLDPVSLAGVTVSSVSLHNEEFIESRDLHLGDKVLVERAGDVIPYIVKALTEVRSGHEKKIIFPKTCPSCGTALEKEEGVAAWRCPNFHCSARTLQRMIFHVSKGAMDIDGFGKSYVEKFYDLGWLKDISDIYELDFDAIKDLEGFGAKSVDNLESAIHKAKQNPISRLLHSLSIHHLGKKASKLIAAEVKDVLDLKEWEEEKYLTIKDIGPVVAQNVSAFFADGSNIVMLEKMRAAGVNMLQTEEDKPIEVSEDAPLVGKSILFTGSLQKMSRAEAKKLAEANGAKTISAVSGKLDILVVGEKAGSKLKKAQDLGTVEILTEEAFLTLINA